MGELSVELCGHAVDLPSGVAILTAVDPNPGNAEMPGCVICEERVVARRQGDGVLVQAPGVQGPPSVALSLNLVRDDDGRVQLGVGGSAVVVVEGHSDDSGDRQAGDAASADVRFRDAVFE